MSHGWPWNGEAMGNSYGPESLELGDNAGENEGEGETR